MTFDADIFSKADKDNRQKQFLREISLIHEA